MAEHKTTLAEFATILQQADDIPDYLVLTGTIRQGHFLCVEHPHYGLVLYVADEDASEARQLWSTVPVREIDNMRCKFGEPPCVN